MKILTSILCLLLISVSVFAQKPKKNTQGRVRESSVPQEWMVPAGSTMLKQDISSIEEANADKYRSTVSFTDGKPQPPVKSFELPAGMRAQQVKLIVLFKRDANWAEPLRNNNLSVTGAFDGALKKYGMKLGNFYSAEDQLDGLVVKFTGDKADIYEAAKAISAIDGVEVVHVKVPR